MSTKLARNLTIGAFALAALTLITMITLWAVAIVVGSPTLGGLGALGILVVILFCTLGGIMWYQSDEADNDYWRSYRRELHEREIDSLKVKLEESETRYKVTLDRLADKEKNCICKVLETEK